MPPIPVKAQIVAFWFGLILAYGLPAAVGVYAELHLAQPLWLLASIVVWSIVSGALHQIALGKLPRWSAASNAPTTNPPVSNPPAGNAGTGAASTATAGAPPAVPPASAAPAS